MGSTRTPTRAQVTLRTAETKDAKAVAEVFSAARREMTFLPRLHTAEDEKAFIAKVVLPSQSVTVASRNEDIVGFIAIDGKTIAHLYVRPGETGRGIGSRLLDDAKAGMWSGGRYSLWCFEANAGARRLYERHGFVAEKVSDGARNEEGLPDLRYAWTAP